MGNVGCTGKAATDVANTIPDASTDDIKWTAILLIAKPGAGKGTVAPKLVDALNIPHLSTGDMLRAAVAANTEAGKQAKSLMEEGKLVPDEIVNAIVAESLQSEKCQNGFILDGYPRNVEQAKVLDAALQNNNRSITHVLNLQVPNESLKVRILGRLIHKPSGRSYHKVFNPPKEEMKDDITGEALEQRSDDNEESLMKRLDAFAEHTAPVLEYYEQTNKSCVFSIDADCKPDEVWTKIAEIVCAKASKEEGEDDEKNQENMPQQEYPEKKENDASDNQPIQEETEKQPLVPQEEPKANE